MFCLFLACVHAALDVRQYSPIEESDYMLSGGRGLSLGGVGRGSIPLAYAPLCSYRFVCVRTWMYYTYVYECTYNSYAYSIYRHLVSSFCACPLHYILRGNVVSSKNIDEHVVKRITCFHESPPFSSSMNSEMLCKL